LEQYLPQLKTNGVIKMSYI